MKNLRLFILLLLLANLRNNSYGTQQTFAFKSEAFSSNGGYSNYELTMENTAYNRKQTIIATQQAATATAASAAANTPINQFIAGLEARVYSQIAANVTSQLFSTTATQGSFNLPSGAKVNWVENAGIATLTIYDPSTNTTTTIQIPVSSLVLSSSGGG